MRSSPDHLFREVVGAAVSPHQAWAIADNFPDLATRDFLFVRIDYPNVTCIDGNSNGPTLAALPVLGCRNGDKSFGHPVDLIESGRRKQLGQAIECRAVEALASA